MTTSKHPNKLGYPLFKITLNEVWLLNEAQKYLRDTKRRKGETLLCFALDVVAEQYPKEIKRVAILQEKIRRSLMGCLTLGWYLGRPYCNDEYHQKIRRIWIRKLLKHNGYL